MTDPRATAPDAGHPLLQRLIDSIEIIDGRACWDYAVMYDVRDALASRSAQSNYLRDMEDSLRQITEAVGGDTKTPNVERVIARVRELAAPQQPANEREAFEKAMREDECPHDWTFEDDGVGGYHNHNTDWAWIGWQARAAIRVGAD